jgi:hypothetical protein
MEDKVHPLVTLLVARAKSHPDEFKEERDTLGGAERWWRAVDTISRNGTDADKAVMASTVGRIAMDKAHEWALDELLNGDERREAIRREKEEMEKRYAAQQTQQAQLYGQVAQNSYRSALSNISGANQSISNSLNLGGETLTAGMLKQIKKALGVK